MTTPTNPALNRPGNPKPSRVVPVTPDGVPTWEEVARDHGRFLYTVAYRLTGNDEDARDIVQDALLRVRRGLETYTPGSLEGWLARIVTNVFLDDVTVSRRHVTVERDSAGFSLRDAGSLNGTYVNRRRIDGAPLHDGDEIQIGKYRLIFHSR